MREVSINFVEQSGVFQVFLRDECYLTSENIGRVRNAIAVCFVSCQKSTSRGKVEALSVMLPAPGYLGLPEHESRAFRE